MRESAPAPILGAEGILFSCQRSRTYCLAPSDGVEPPFLGSEPSVLPLDEPGMIFVVPRQRVEL
jgi:hypothetical protein